MNPIDQMDHPALAICLPLSRPGAPSLDACPSATVFPEDEPWITVDAARSNDLVLLRACGRLRLQGIGDTAQAPRWRARPACAHARPPATADRRPRPSFALASAQNGRASAAMQTPSMYSSARRHLQKLASPNSGLRQLEEKGEAAPLGWHRRRISPGRAGQRRRSQDQPDQQPHGKFISSHLRQTPRKRCSSPPARALNWRQWTHPQRPVSPRGKKGPPGAPSSSSLLDGKPAAERGYSAPMHSRRQSLPAIDLARSRRGPLPTAKSASPGLKPACTGWKPNSFTDQGVKNKPAIERAAQAYSGPPWKCCAQ